MRGFVRKGLKAAADLILPRVCIVCGRRLNTEESYLCLHCLADLPLTRYHTMKHNPMADRFNSLIDNGIEKGYAYADALFFYSEDAGFRKITHQIKYHGNISAGRHFGTMLGKSLAVSPWMKDVDMVIPVPLHWRRKWKRGYNQAEIIAEGISESLGIPLRTDILKRRRHTQTQTRLDVADKMSNVENAFVARKKSCCEMRHILLVDDVFTTGSTLYSCFRALRAVFPEQVRISVATLGFVGD